LFIQPFDVFGTQEPLSSPTVASSPVPPSSPPLLLPEELPLLDPEEPPLLPPDELLPDELPDVDPPEEPPELELPWPLLLPPDDDVPDDDPFAEESAVPHPARARQLANRKAGTSETRTGA
jgi:hypothetical protein